MFNFWDECPIIGFPDSCRRLSVCDSRATMEGIFLNNSPSYNMNLENKKCLGLIVSLT